MSDLSFPDLRAFLDALRGGTSSPWSRPRRAAARDARDSPPRDRGGRARAPLLKRPWARTPPRHEPLRHGATGPARVRRRERERFVERLVDRPRSFCLRLPGSSRPLGRGARGLADRGATRRSGPVSDVATPTCASTACPHSPAGPKTAGPSSRCPSSTRSIPTPGPQQPRHVPAARARRAHDGHALADRQGRRFHYARPRRAAKPYRSPSSSAARPPSSWPRSRPARELPELMLASLIAGQRRALSRARGRIRSSPTQSSRSSATCPPGPPARRPVRRSLRLLLAATRLPGLPRRRTSAGGATRSTRRRSWASRGRRTSTSATCSRSCSPAVSARDAGGRPSSGRTARPATTRWPPPWSNSGTRARPWPRPSASWAKASSR